MLACHSFFLFPIRIRKVMMEQVTAELAHVQAERRRLEKHFRKQERRRCLRRDRAWRVASIAFCHVPTAGQAISTAILRKYGDCIDMGVDECAMEIERRFLEARVDDLARWLEWTADVPPAELLEAKRLVEEARLLAWVQDQNSIQGISPPPLFVWEKHCALSIENSSAADARASAHRPPRSAGGKMGAAISPALGPHHGPLASEGHSPRRHHAKKRFAVRWERN